LKLEFQNFQVDKDIEILQLLLGKAFPEADFESTFSKDVLNWKYSSATRKMTCFLGFFNDQPASFYGVLPRTYISGGNDHSVGLVVDVLTATEFLGYGLFTQSGQYVLSCLEQTPVSSVIGFPIRPEVLPGHLNVGWEVRFVLPVYVYPIGLGISVGFKKKMLNRFLRIFAFLLQFLRKFPKGNARVLDLQTFLSDPEVADFYRRTRNGNTVSLKKDTEFLRWRLNRPNTEYFCFTYGEKAVNACAVVRVLEMNGYTTAAIVDIDAESGFCGRAITENVIDFAKEKRVDLIGVCMNQSFFKKLGLRRLGFIPSLSKFKVITRKTGQNDIAFEEMNSQITWLDSDTV
jgi:hypothetical protein